MRSGKNKATKEAMYAGSEAINPQLPIHSYSDIIRQGCKQNFTRGGSNL